MILVYFAAIAVIVGYVRGGRLSGILDMKIRWVLCPVLGFLLEALYAPIFALYLPSIIHSLKIFRITPLFGRMLSFPFLRLALSK